jgi:hypothetical protein
MFKYTSRKNLVLCLLITFVNYCFLAVSLLGTDSKREIETDCNGAQDCELITFLIGHDDKVNDESFKILDLEDLLYMI